MDIPQGNFLLRSVLKNSIKIWMKILFNKFSAIIFGAKYFIKKLSDSIVTLTYFYQIPYTKNVKV